MIWWTQPTRSGLGDRLIDIVHLLAYARVKGHGLYVAWPEFQAKAIDVAHRREDILLGNVQRHIQWPRDLQMFIERFACPPFDAEQFNEGIGGDPDGFHEKHLGEVCSAGMYRVAVASVLADIGFCGPITEVLATLPPKFVSLHIRRGDKVRGEKDGTADGTFINHAGLAELDRLTYDAIDQCIAFGFDTYFLCGDEDEKLKPFEDYLVAKDKWLVQLPRWEKWRETYLDLAVMSKSKVVITSNKYSAYSRLGAMLGGATWSTVYMMRRANR
jgi:hypothetical protein